MEQKLHTPEGVRDIYNKECEIKLTLQKKLSTVLHSYEISLHYARISLLPLPGQLQRFLRRRIFQSACAMPAILLSTIPVIRDG